MRCHLVRWIGINGTGGCGESGKQSKYINFTSNLSFSFVCVSSTSNLSFSFVCVSSTSNKK
jgi:hypothetical protein